MLKTLFTRTFLASAALTIGLADGAGNGGGNDCRSAPIAQV